MITDLLMSTDLSALASASASAWAGSALALPVTSDTTDLGAGVCPALPGDVGTTIDMILSWAKGLLLAVIPISAIACLLVIALGKFINSPRAGQAGAVGLGVVLAVAVGYGVIFGILQAIVGGTC